MTKSFSDLGINEQLNQGLADLQISVPTDIQEKTIPVVLNQKEDLVALAKTGTGKTAAFGLPLLQLINIEDTNVQVVILAPTRELGHQIHANLISFASQSPAISIAAVCGGIPIKPQMERLKTATQIVVATPGRLVDLIKRGAINIRNIKYLVLDEADEMVSALKIDLDLIIKDIPKSRRTLLFTATMPGAIKQLVQNYMSKHVIQIEADMSTVGHQGIDHQYVVVEPIEKLEVLLHFLNTKEGERGIIFCKTKAAVNKLAKKLVDAGVLVSLEPSGQMERMNSRNLPFYAGTAVAHGLTKEQALQLITQNPAKIMGIDNMYGTLEHGKSATLFISL